MFIAIPSWSADVKDWFDQPQENTGAREIKIAKDYYENKYSFDSTKECSGRCLPPGTNFFCGEFTYIKDVANSREYQF